MVSTFILTALHKYDIAINRYTKPKAWKKLKISAGNKKIRETYGGYR